MTWTDASAELEEMHEAVAGVRCSYCGAGVAQRCANPITGKPPKVPHLARVRAVDEATSSGE